MKYYYDLHIHTGLSPCADDDMTPNNIAAMSRLKGLSIIGAADHNSVKNLRAMERAAKENGLLLVPAMELETAEEFHMLCLFRDIRRAEEFGEYTASKMPAIKNKKNVYGPQLLFDEKDCVTGEEENLLAVSSGITAGEAVRILKELDALAVPAHVDRPSYSVISNLGAIPEELGFTAAEVANPLKYEELSEKHPILKGLRIITDSDAHNLGLISEPVHFMELSSLSIASVFEYLGKKTR